MTLRTLGVVGSSRKVDERHVASVNAPMHAARMVHLEHEDLATHLNRVLTEDGPVPLAPFLAGHDVVVNCTLQDPTAPSMFLLDEDVDAFAFGSLIIDVSCDQGMGFEWARPTSFSDPEFMIGDHVRYYAVDHSPSYLWDSASWEISEALLPFLRVVMEGAASWDENETILRAIEIREGRVLNPAILAFQDRVSAHPHEPAPR